MAFLPLLIFYMWTVRADQMIRRGQMLLEATDSKF